MHAARAAAAAAAAASATAAAGASQLVAFAEEKGEGVRSSAADLASRAEDKGEGVRASAAQLVALAENKGEEVCARLGELAQRARGGAQDTDGGGSKGTKAGEGGKSVKGGGGGGAGVRRDYDWAAGQEELGQSEAVLAVAACLAQMLETAESRSLLAMPEASATAKALVWVVGLKLLADAHSQAHSDTAIAAGATAGIPVTELHSLQYWATVSKALYEQDTESFVKYLLQHQRPAPTQATAADGAQGAAGSAGDAGAGTGGGSVLREVGSAVKGAFATARLAVDKAIAKRAGQHEDAAAAHTSVGPDDVLSAVWTSRPAQPAHVVYVDHAQRAIVLAVRGTHSVHDALTDMGLDAVPFMSSYAHRGMVESSRWLVQRTAPVLAAAVLAHPGYHVLVTGHSLGAGVAMLSTLLLRGTRRRDARAALDAYDGPMLGKRHSGLMASMSVSATLKEATCVAFATPPCVSPELASDAAPHVTNVVLGSDVIARASEAAYVDFLNELVTFSAEQAAAVTGELTSKWEEVESGIKRRVDDALLPYLTGSTGPEGATAGAGASSGDTATAAAGKAAGARAGAAGGSTGRFANMVKSVADQVYERSRKDREGLKAQLADTQAQLTAQVKALTDAQMGPEATAAVLRSLQAKHNATSGGGDGTSGDDPDSSEPEARAAAAPTAMPHVRMVTPGRPLHVVYDGNGVEKSKAAHIVQRGLGDFNAIQLTKTMLDDHKMDSYIAALELARNTRARSEHD